MQPGSLHSNSESADGEGTLHIFGQGRPDDSEKSGQREDHEECYRNQAFIWRLDQMHSPFIGGLICAVEDALIEPLWQALHSFVARMFRWVTKVVIEDMIGHHVGGVQWMGVIAVSPARDLCLRRHFGVKDCDCRRLIQFELHNVSARVEAREHAQGWLTRLKMTELGFVNDH